MSVARLFIFVGLIGCSAQERVDSNRAALTSEQCDVFQENGTDVICHYTGSSKHPYTILQVNLAACRAAHASHAGDYIALDDPTCSGAGCFPEGAPWDGSVECCDGLAPIGGYCRNIDDCPPDACLNGGTCVDGLNSYTCQCPDGFDGPRCEPACPQLVTQDGVVATLRDPATAACILDRDANNLLQTVQLSSHTVLDCRGHKITPAARGVLGNANSRSTPELAVLLDGAHDVDIENCVFEGFDHGVLAINSKLPTGSAPSNRIAQNAIEARFVPVHLTSSDGFLVEGNTLTWKTRGGAGIFVHSDSDHNQIRGNRVVGDFASTTQGAVLFPGPTATVSTAGRNSNPVFTSGNAAIVVVQILGPYPHLFNAVVGGRLLQLEDHYAEFPDEGFTSDNLLEGNVVTYRQPNTTEDGAVCSTSLGTVVRGNTFGSSTGDGGRRSSIRGGAIRPIPPGGTLPASGGRQYPGRCSLDAGRKCLSDFDCNVPGVDPVGLGTCTNLPALRYPEWYTQDFLVEGNTMYPPLQIGVAINSNNAVVTNNEIFGPLAPALAGQNRNAIIIEGKYAFESAIISHNRIKDCEIALTLVRSFQGLTATTFGAQLSGNNITGYQTAIRTTGNDLIDGSISGELSVAGMGNYWGNTCEEGGFQASSVRHENGSINPYFVDSHPFGQTVPADAVASALPATCF